MIDQVTVYRFGATVAVSISPYNADGETIYLSEDMATRLASLLSDCAWEIRNIKFTDSSFGTRLIEEVDNGKDEERSA